ncbi:hypothetical protein MNBD_GAMMA03-1524 [hydrothermal vent metagenome]|uniref:SGNH hydrolase-type esterase domain-containing protein n=1 Tax=hydrothermal vent metagenome TaxID=652676 RepID=A0A3B0W4C0_9ZZZZ
MSVKKGVSLIGLLMVVGLISCSQPSIEPLDKDAVIVAFGDSLTVGYGVSEDKSYPAILQKLSGYQVVNEGVSGEVTREGVLRFSAVLERHQPQLVVLFEGGNDLLRNVPAIEIEKNLAQMIAIAQAQQVSVLLIGMPEKKLFSNTAPFYKKLSKQWQVPLEADIVGHLMIRASMKSDYIHFNEKGYQKLAKAIYEKLQVSGAL